MIETVKKQLPGKGMPGKVTFLVKGKKGVTITLFIDKNRKVATASPFIGMPMKWYVQGPYIFIKGNFDAMEVNLTVSMEYLSLLVHQSPTS